MIGLNHINQKQEVTSPNQKSKNKNKYQSEQFQVNKLNEEITRQIRFDPLIQQLDFLLRKCPKSQEKSFLSQNLYNPFEFHILPYKSYIIKSTIKKEQLTFRRQIPIKKPIVQLVQRPQKSQLTQWERTSQEYTDIY